MAAFKRGIQIGSMSRSYFAKSGGFGSVHPQISRFSYSSRKFSELQIPDDKRRALLVDTLALVLVFSLNFLRFCGLFGVYFVFRWFV